MKVFLATIYLCTLFCVLATPPQKIVILDGFHLHEYNLRYNWHKIEKQFTKIPIQELHIHNCIISQSGFKKILEYDLSQLKILDISSGNNLHPNVVKLLVEQQFIYNSLETLILDNCNLQCEDFENLKQLTSKITKISLKQNFLSYKGFQYLARLKVNLTSLNIQRNSLIHQQSIQSLMSMGIKNIKELNLVKTSISGQNLLKILQKIDVQNLQKLHMGQNQFPLQFYQQFSKMNFKSLQEINWFNLIIEDNAVQYLKNMQLPSLKYLHLGSNQLTNEGLKQILLKKKLPKLQTLMLNVNFINSSLIRHLKEQDFKLKHLQMRIISMDSHGLRQLTQIDLSQMEFLEYSHSVVNPLLVQDFFKKANLTNLKKLIFTNLQNTGQLLKNIVTAKLPNLQEIQLSDFGDIDSTLLTKRYGIFPNLKVAKLKSYNFDHQLQKKILENIHKIAPKLQYFQFSVIDPRGMVQGILNKTYKIQVNSGLYISILNYGGKSVYYERQLPIIKIKLQPEKSIKIIQLNVVVIINQIVGYLAETNRISMIQTNNLQKFIEIFMNGFDYTELVSFQDLNFIFLRWYSKTHKQCKFLNMTVLSENNAVNGNLQILNSCQIPNLQTVIIDFNQRNAASTTINYKGYNYVSRVFWFGLSTQMYINMYRKYKMEYLKALRVDNSNLTPQNVSQIMEGIPYINRVRSFSLSENFLNKNLSFLGQYQLRLNQLSLNSVLLNQEVFNQLCLINYQFIQDLSFQKLGMKDKDMISLLQCLSNKSATIFPKLFSLDFSNNYLQTKGISAFMSLDLPLIQNVQFLNNKDEEYFNSIFRHRSSKRLRDFTSIGNYFSGIDHEIPKTHTRRIQKFQFLGQSIRGTDIQQLSQLSFDSLIQFTANLKKINDCQSLQNIRKINTHTKEFYLLLSNAEGIHSSCLTDIQSSQILPERFSLSINTPYAQARKFAEYFFNPGQGLILINLVNVYISDQKLLEIIKTSEMSKIQSIILKYNDLSSVSIRELLSREYPMIESVDLSDNQKITSSGLEKMNNFKYEKLNYLALDDTMFGDEGIKYLIRNQFPELIILRLKNSEITGEGLAFLSSLRAPKLKVLDISCNDLSVEDILKLNVQKFPQLILIVIYPSLSSLQLQKLDNKLNMKTDDGQIGRKNKINFHTDIWYDNKIQTIE